MEIVILLGLSLSFLLQLSHMVQRSHCEQLGQCSIYLIFCKRESGKYPDVSQTYLVVYKKVLTPKQDLTLEATVPVNGSPRRELGKTGKAFYDSRLGGKKCVLLCSVWL